MTDFVEDREKTANELDFWLNSISAHKPARSPSVFVVATHIDKVSEQVFLDACKFLEARLGDKFLTFFNVPISQTIAFPIDNTKGPSDERLRSLQLAIQTVAQESTDYANETPIRWLQCEKAIQVLCQQDTAVFSKTKQDLRLELQPCCRNMKEEDFQLMLEEFHHSGALWLPGAFLFVYLCVCLFMCMFVYLYVCLFVCLFTCMFLYWFVCLLVYLFICLYIYLYVCLFICMFIRMSVYLSFCLFVYLSIFLFVIGTKLKAPEPQICDKLLILLFSFSLFILLSHTLH